MDRVERTDLPQRLRTWREGKPDLSLRRLQALLNQVLPKEQRVSFNTLANYEKPGSPGPRAEVVGALKDLYPNLRLEWLLQGDGLPTVEEQEELERLNREFPVSKPPDPHAELGTQLRQQCSDFNLLSVTAQRLFVDVLVRYIMTASDSSTETVTEREMEGRWTEILDLARGLLAYVRLPWHPLSWGFVNLESRTHERQVDQYVIAVLNALDGLLVERGKGAPMDRSESSLLRKVTQLEDVLTEPSEAPGWLEDR